MAAAKTAKTNSRIDKSLIKPMMQAFTQNALPGENEGFDSDASEKAAAFMLELAIDRAEETALVAVDSFSDQAGRLATRIAICNDDMPFLVDSVASALVNQGLNIQRVIHPVVSVKRTADGRLESISADRNGNASRESMIYVEANRVDASQRRAIENTLAEILREVRFAVADWPDMLDAMEADAASLPDDEGAALIRWFHAGNMTVLGHEILGKKGHRDKRLGLSRANDAPILSDASVDLASYKARMQEGQEAIYYITAENHQAA